MNGTRVLVSYAQSLDGKIAMLSGESQWISGNETLSLAHELRRENEAILVGIGTVLQDDPELSCRIPDCQSPIRVVLDSRLRLPEDSRICRTADRYATVVFSTQEAIDATPERLKTIRQLGIEVEAVPHTGKGLSVRAVLHRLGEMGYRSVFVEGGSGVITSFLAARCVDRLVLIVSPLFIGRGTPAVSDLGVRNIADALQLSTTSIRFLGRDLVWELTADGSGQPEAQRAGSKHRTGADDGGR